MKSLVFAVRTMAVAVSLAIMVMSVPFSPAETFARTSVGVIMTPGTVRVGNIQAPTGTTVFAGDRIATTDPAIISLKDGSRIEMTKAVTTLSSEGKTIVMKPVEGLYRFNFAKGENVQIQAGRYNLTATGTNSAITGELGLNQKGEVILAMKQGSFTSVDRVSGIKTVIAPGNPLIAANLSNSNNPNPGAGGSGFTAGPAFAAAVVGTLGLVSVVYVQIQQKTVSAVVPK
jgi:hypothetical protein